MHQIAIKISAQNPVAKLTPQRCLAYLNYEASNESLAALFAHAHLN